MAALNCVDKAEDLRSLLSRLLSFLMRFQIYKDTLIQHSVVVISLETGVL